MRWLTRESADWLGDGLSTETAHTIRVLACWIIAMVLVELSWHCHMDVLYMSVSAEFCRRAILNGQASGCNIECIHIGHSEMWRATMYYESHDYMRVLWLLHPLADYKQTSKDICEWISSLFVAAFSISFVRGIKNWEMIYGFREGSERTACKN